MNIAQEWIRRKERGNTFWFHVITWIALRIGRPVAWALLYPITLYFFLTSPSSRRASIAFLSAALDRRASRADSFRHHRHFACTILDRVYLLTGRLDSLDIRIHGAEPILDYIAAGRGCMLLGSHLGSFEVLRVLGARHEAFSLKVLMYEEQSKAMMEFIRHLDPHLQKVMIPMGRPNSMLLVKESVEQGNLVGLLGDRSLPTEKTCTCEFLGKEASFPTGPITLAIVLQIPVYLFFGMYSEPNRYDIHFELLSDVVHTSRPERAAVVEKLTRRFAEQLEHYAKQWPFNWFNFYDFWQSN